MNGSISSTDKNGNKNEEILITYSEEERQRHEVEGANSELIWRQKYLTIETSMFGRGLTHTEILLLSFINSFLGNERARRFYFTNEQLCAKLDVSEPTVTRAFKNLKAAGLLAVHHKPRANGGIIRFVEIPTHQKDHSDSSKRSLGSDQKDQVDVLELSCIEEKRERKRSTSPLLPPTSEEVRDYIAARKGPVNAAEFHEWYETAEWKDRDGKPLKNWKLKILSWEKRYYAENPNAVPRVETTRERLERKMGIKIHPDAVFNDEKL